MSRCPSLENLLAYRVGELSPAEDERVEEHYFACERCTARLESLARLRDDVAQLVRDGRVTACVTTELLDAAARDGVRIRVYDLSPGETVLCTIAPEDDFVAIRLRGEFEKIERIDLAVRALMRPTGERESRGAQALPVDAASGELVMLHSGHSIRGLPRSRFELELRAPDERLLASYALEHTPWDEQG